ncbi:MAG: NADH-quinone oxidoreductase subunit M [Acidobacteriaceae bacterium]|jgi:NADH-quinone oxidoreductase subunit M
MMNIDHIILTLIVFTPLAGALLLALLPDRGKTMQWAALAVTLATFGLTLHLPFHYSYASQPGGFQFEQNLPWIASPAIHYHLGVNGLSMWLMVLTGLLAPLGVLISWRAIGQRKKLFYVLFLLQQVAMMGIFVSLDMFLYYAFWEMSLVPMTILIATFGRSERRRFAAIKYFLYAFIPSALLLVAMLWLYAQTGTFDLPKLADLAAQHAISPNAAALWIASLGFLIAFSVKVPIFPLHGWLVDAIAEAPTAAVMVLAGKTALYSMLRFSFAIFPEQSHRIAPLMIALAAIGIVYGGLLALVQHDLKKLAAYSTLGQLSFIVLGIFTFTVAGLDGGIYQILNESLAGAALFMLLGLLYERYNAYDMRQYGGLAQKLPWVATMFVLVALSIIGLPMLNSFVGEFLILSGSMQGVYANHHLWTAIATTGVILSAAYMLRLVQRVFYCDVGPKPQAVAGWDLDAREHLALWPVVALFLAMGVASPLWMRAIDGTAATMADHPASVNATLPNPIHKIEAETYQPANAASPHATSHQTTSPQTTPGGAR